MRSSAVARKRFRVRATPLAGTLALTLSAGFAASTSAFAHPVLDASPFIGAAALAAEDSLQSARGPEFSTPDADGRANYAVVLKEPALASYTGQNRAFAAIPKMRSAEHADRMDVHSAEAGAYVAHLQQQQTLFVADLAAQFSRNVDVVTQYQHALNGVVLKLTAEEADFLRQRDDVLLVDRERIRKPVTYASPTYIGATTLWNDTSAPNGLGYKGEGIVIGEIDSGINYLSNSFKATGDDGYTPVNPLGSGNYLGQCRTGRGDAGRCNSKLIGMYNLDSSGTSASGRDLDGHGTHTASTAGGNVTNNAPYAGGSFNVSGIAPHANIIAYMACGNCTTTGLNGAINQAVADGVVDVINYSIGGPNDGPWLDSTDQAFLGALNAGIFVATAAGNDGPAVGSLDSYAPWYTTVAATTPGSLPGFALTAAGWSGTAAMVAGAAPLPTQAYTNLPLIESPTFADGSNDGCTAYPANYFRRPQTAAGAQGIAVLRLDQNASNCGSGARRTNAANAGALAVLYVDPEFINLGATGASYSLMSENWDAIKATVGDVSGATGTATGSISYPTAGTPRGGDRVTGFSSRGPTVFGTLKPDIAAPGDVVLAAMSPTAASGYNNAATASVIYGTESGTSMATPHIAGAAALIRQAHRDWTPMEVKSALMTTAKSALMLGDGITPANPNQKGAGRVDLTIASKAGLVFNETGANFQAANPATGGKPETLNIASYYHVACAGTCVFPRTVRSTGKATTWTIAVTGLPSGSYSLDKTSFTLGSTGVTSYKLTVNTASLTMGQWYYGDLSLTPADATIPTAHLPIAIRPATAKLVVDTDSIAVSASAGGTANRTVVISNGGNPSLNWSIPTDRLQGTVIKRKASDSGLQDRTIVTSSTTTAIESTNANNAYGADWFDIHGNGTKLVSLQMEGFSSTGAAVSTFATQFAWRIWADNGSNAPNGRPGKTVAGDQDPVFQFPAAAGGLPPAGAGLSYDGQSVRLDLAAAGAASPALAAGRYWLNMAPSISGTGTIYYQLLSQVSGKTPAAQYSLPNNSTASNKAWRDTTTSSLGGAGYNGYAMEVVVDATCGASWMTYDSMSGSIGLAGSKAVAVTFNASGLSPGTYKTYLCVSGNGTSPPYLGQGGDSKLVPVTFTVNAPSTPLAASDSNANPTVVAPGDTTQLSLQVTPGTNPASTGVQVKGDLTAIGGSASQAFTANGNTWSFNATIPMGTSLGGKVIPVTVTDGQSRSATATIALAVANTSGLPLAGTGMAEPSTVRPGEAPLLMVAVTPATGPSSSGVQVKADLVSIGGSATQAFYDDGTNGDAVAGDGVYSYRPTVPTTTAPGSKSLAVTISDAQTRTASTTIGLTVAPSTTALVVSSGTATPSTVNIGASTLLTARVTPGANPASSGLNVRGDLSTIGGSSSQLFYDDGTHGDVTAGDGVYSFSASVAANTVAGSKNLTVTASDAQARSASTNIALTVPTQTAPAASSASASVTSVPPGSTTQLTVVVAPGTNPASTGLAVNADLTAIGGGANQALSGSGNTFTFTATVAAGTGAGVKLLPIKIADAQGRAASSTIGLSVPSVGSPSGTGLAAPASVNPGASALLMVTTAPGSNPVSTGLTVTVNTTAIGGSATQTFYDDGTHGDQTAGDGVFSFQATVPTSTAVGQKNLTATIADAQGRSGSAVVAFSVVATPTAPAASSAAANPPVVTLGATTQLSVVVVPGTNPASTGLQVKADLTSIGGSASQAFTGSGNTFTFNATVPTSTAPGVKLLPVTISDAQARTTTTTIGLSVPQQGAPSGAGLAAPVALAPGQSGLLMVSTIPGSNPASTGLTVKVDLNAIGGSATQTFYDDGTHGDQAAGDGVFSLQTTVAAGTALGQKNLPATITDAQARSGNAVIQLDVIAASVAPSGNASASPSELVAGATAHLLVAVTPGANPPSTGLEARVDLSAIGGSATQAMQDDGSGQFSFDAMVAAGTTPGVKVLPVTITDAQQRSASAVIGLVVLTPQSPSGTGLAVPAMVPAGDATLLLVTTHPGSNPGSTGLRVAADLRAIGGGNAETLYDDGTHGDQVAGDGVFSLQTQVTAETPEGALVLPATIADDQGRSGNAAIQLQVLPGMPEWIFRDGFDGN